MHCACNIADSDDNHPLRLNPCPEHERWAKAIRQSERDRCAVMVEYLRAEWFHGGIPGDLAVPAGAFARSMDQLAAVMRDPSADHVETN